MSAFNPGDVVRLSATFAVNGTPTDPTTVTLRHRMTGDADWMTLTYAGATVTKDGTGEYHADVTLTEAGRLYYNWTGTGSCTAAEGGSLRVHELPGVPA